MKHEVIWTQPPPFWTSPALKYVPERLGVIQRPELLRFTTDSFMDEFMDLLATEPKRLSEFKVQPETWRGFTPSPVPQKRKPASAVLDHLRLFRAPPRNGSRTIHHAAEPVVPPPDIPLKLYQPAHQRYYLVTSSLVCRVPGLPDRAVNSSRDERAGFVMRRLLPPTDRPDAPVSDWEEHAWVPGNSHSTWKSLRPDNARQYVGGEELLPMFSMRFDEPDHPRRRLFAGILPAGKREAYLGAPKANGQTQPGVTPRTARKILLRQEVIEPWKNLVTRAQQVGQSLVPPFEEDGEPSNSQKQERLKLEREQIQTVSWLVLLDFARFLATYLKPVWRALLDPAETARLNGAQQTLLLALNSGVVGNTLKQKLQYRGFTVAPRNRLYPSSSMVSSLAEALALYRHSPGSLNTDLQQLLETVVEPYDRHQTSNRHAWPSFLFPLADPEHPGASPVPPISNASVGTLTSEETEDQTLTELAGLSETHRRLDRLGVLVIRALENSPSEPVAEPEVPTAAVAPADALEGWFVIRCVYDRPSCEPLHQAVVSDPTEAFQLAGFFDPDAPARPIRIGLPIDTTPAGLRKHKKNTAFVISNTLCGQIQRMKSISLGDLVRSVLPWPLHKDLPVPEKGPCKSGTGVDLGMVCSLSIPIITLCALLLLMIIVNLLDIVFRWLPYFILCFPIPGLKAKRS